MKYTHHICILMLLMFMGSFVSSYAEDMLVSTSISENDKQALLENINFAYISKEPDKRAIKCFDVHLNGDIAIGSSKSTEKAVCVYSSQGLFKYGYRFNCSGDFGVEFDGENLTVWFLRSSIAITVTPTRKIIAVREFENNTAYSAYWRDDLRSKTRKVDEKIYSVSNDMGFLNIFAASYSQLTLIDENGEIHILYDVNEDQFAVALLRFALIAILVIFWLIFISYALKQFRKIRKKDHI